MNMRYHKALPCLIAVNLTLLTVYPVFAQSPSPSRVSAFTEVFFNPPPEDKKPEQTRGAGSRQGRRCLPSVTVSSTFLTPLVPPSEFGLTTQERPTLWVMIPETKAEKLILSIKDETGRHHSQTIIPLKGQSGLIPVQPSTDQPSLEVDTTYQWGVVLVCGKKPSPDDPAIAVRVRRVTISPPFSPEISLKQAAWYGDQGIWYDAVTTLMAVWRSQPNAPQMRDIWHKFLESAGVQDEGIPAVAL